MRFSYLLLIIWNFNDDFTFYDAINRMICISKWNVWNKYFANILLSMNTKTYSAQCTDHIMAMTYGYEWWQYDNNDNVISAHKLTITICEVLTYDCTKGQQNLMFTRVRNQIKSWDFFKMSPLFLCVIYTIRYTTLLRIIIITNEMSIRSTNCNVNRNRFKSQTHTELLKQI